MTLNFECNINLTSLHDFYYLYDGLHNFNNIENKLD